MARIRTGATALMLAMLVVVATGVAQTNEPAQPAAATAPVTTQPAGPTDILDAIPADAWGYAIVPDMQALSNTITSVGQQLGLPVPPVLALAKFQTGLLMGIHDGGSLGLVWLNMMEHPEPIAIIVPVTDATQMLQTLQPTDAGDGVQQITVAGAPTFAAVKGKFVVLGPSKTVAQAVAKLGPGVGGSLNDTQRKVYKSSNLFIHVDVDKAWTMAKPMLAPMMAMAMQPPGAAPTSGPATHPVIEMFDQIAALDVGLKLEASGLLSTMLLAAKPNTDLATGTAMTAMTDKPLLVGLPAVGEAMMLTFGGITPGDAAIDAKALRAQQEQAMANIFANPEIAALIDKDKAAALQSKLTDLFIDQIKQYAVSISALPGGDGGIVGAAKVLRVKDSAATMVAVREMIDMIKAMFVDPEVVKALDCVVYKADAEKIGEVSVDHLLLDLDRIEDLGDEDKQMLLNAFGAEGFVARIAPVDKELVVATFGGGAKRFNDVAKLAVAGKSPLAEDPGIAKVAAKMPATRNCEFYIGGDGIMQLIKAIAELQQEPLPFAVEPIGAPIGLNAGIDGTAWRYDAVLPIEVMSAVASLAMQAMTSGMGPGGPDEPAPMPPPPAPDF